MVVAVGLKQSNGCCCVSNESSIIDKSRNTLE